MMELLPLDSSPLPQQEHSPACDFPDTGVSQNHLCCTFPTSPGSALLTVFPHRQNLTTLLQFKTKIPFSVIALCILSSEYLLHWGHDGCNCTRTFKKLYFFYEPIINPALKHIFFCFDVSVSDHFLPNCKHAAPWEVQLMKPAFQ